MDQTSIINILAGTTFEYIPPEIAVYIISHLDVERRYLLAKLLDCEEYCYKENIILHSCFKKNTFRGHKTGISSQILKLNNEYIDLLLMRHHCCYDYIFPNACVNCPVNHKTGCEPIQKSTIVLSTTTTEQTVEILSEDKRKLFNVIINLIDPYFKDDCLNIFHCLQGRDVIFHKKNAKNINLIKILRSYDQYIVYILDSYNDKKFNRVITLDNNYLTYSIYFHSTGFKSYVVHNYKNNKMLFVEGHQYTDNTAYSLNRGLKYSFGSYETKEPENSITHCGLYSYANACFSKTVRFVFQNKKIKYLILINQKKCYWSNEIIINDITIIDILTLHDKPMCPHTIILNKGMSYDISINPLSKILNKLCRLLSNKENEENEEKNDCILNVCNSLFANINDYLGYYKKYDKPEKKISDINKFPNKQINIIKNTCKSCINNLDSIEREIINLGLLDKIQDLISNAEPITIVQEMDSTVKIMNATKRNKNRKKIFKYNKNIQVYSKGVVFDNIYTGFTNWYMGQHYKFTKKLFGSSINLLPEYSSTIQNKKIKQLQVRATSEHNKMQCKISSNKIYNGRNSKNNKTHQRQYR